MKLLYCKNCDSVVRLTLKKRKCECWKTQWVHIDNLNAIYTWKYAHPFWIDNNSFWVRIREDYKENMMYNLMIWLDEEDGSFKAFSLMREINGCSKTFKKVTKKYFINLEVWTKQENK
jgi:hypothetical protein